MCSAANAGSVTSTADIGGRMQTCYILVSNWAVRLVMLVSNQAVLLVILVSSRARTISILNFWKYTIHLCRCNNLSYIPAFFKIQGAPNFIYFYEIVVKDNSLWFTRFTSFHPNWFPRQRWLHWWWSGFSYTSHSCLALSTILGCHE